MPNQMTAPPSRQQELVFRPHSGARPRGGARPHAGRKPNEPGRPRLRHAKRPQTQKRFPVHVTKRVRADVTRLRRFELCAVLRRAFVYGCRMETTVDDVMVQFRICQFSIQGNHIHLICEASSNAALAMGIQAWSVRVARGLNAHMDRRGSVFDDRYHMRILRTPTETRHALCYVLQNARRHQERLPARFHGMDPFSSAWWFDGWDDHRWKAGLSPPQERTVAVAETWLLRIGWKRSPFGLLSIREVPPAGRRVGPSFSRV